MVNNESPPHQMSDPPPTFLESVVEKLDHTFAVMNRGVCLFILFRVPQWIWRNVPSF